MAYPIEVKLRNKPIYCTALFLSLFLGRAAYASETITLKTLTNLMEALSHAENGYATAAESVDNEIQKTTFSAFALKHAQFRQELKQKAEALGKNLENQPPASEKVTSNGWLPIKATANTKDTPTILEILERGERHTQNIYEEALKNELDPTVRALIEDQYREIKSSHETLLGLEKEAKTPIPQEAAKTMQLTSPGFKHNEMIPKKFTCQGQDVNPELVIGGIPPKTKSLVLIMEDPDAVKGTWLHWMVYDIPPVTSRIAENSIPGKEGMNSFGREHYGGPCPPSGTHRYFFKLYALDQETRLEEGADRKILDTAMENHVLAEAELIGLYKKQ